MNSEDLPVTEDEAKMARQLNPGDLFPEYRVEVTDGTTLNVPADLRGEYAVIIFYRGIW